MAITQSLRFTRMTAPNITHSSRQWHQHSVWVQASRLVEQIGGADWWSRLVEQIGGADWWSRLVEQIGGADWWSRLVEQIGGADWWSSILVLIACCTLHSITGYSIGMVEYHMLDVIHKSLHSQYCNRVIDC